MYAKLIQSGMETPDSTEPEGNCWGLGGIPSGFCFHGWIPLWWLK